MADEPNGAGKFAPRKIIKTAAWAMPVLALAVASPALSSSGDDDGGGGGGGGWGPIIS